MNCVSSPDQTGFQIYSVFFYAGKSSEKEILALYPGKAIPQTEEKNVHILQNDQFLNSHLPTKSRNQTHKVFSPELSNPITCSEKY